MILIFHEAFMNQNFKNRWNLEDDSDENQCMVVTNAYVPLSHAKNQYLNLNISNVT